MSSENPLVEPHGYAIGEFLCPDCGGLANVVVSEVLPADFQPRPPGYPAPAISWWPAWGAYVRVELVCQGPADPNAPEDEWDRVGKTIDMLATGYRPICLN